MRATEPYLDEYADGMPELRRFIVDLFRGGDDNSRVGRGFVKIGAATGRHYALIAQKGSSDGVEEEQPPLVDLRFLDDGRYALEDTHLKPWGSKEI